MKRSLILILSLIINAACADQTPFTAPHRSLASGPAVGDDLEHNLDNKFAALAGDIPGFGGMYFDSDGKLHIYLLNSSDRERAVEVLTRELANWDLGLPNGAAPDVASLQVHLGQYDFKQLRDWHRLAAVVFSVRGVLTTDADETQNRIVVGVRDIAVEPLVREVALRAGIPSSALTVEQREPLQDRATLQDMIRPAKGGLQLGFFESGQATACTLGFNARRKGTLDTLMFITNSHCSIQRGVNDAIPYYQSDPYNNQHLIGIEFNDPPYFTSSTDPACPPSFACRYSDALMARYLSDNDGILGRIARTIDSSTTVGSLTISSASPEFSITQFRMTGPLVNEQVHKVGIGSGWTYGNVFETCVTVGSLNESVAYICQANVHAGNLGGDSGAPVFLRTGSSTVTLIGMLWSGSATEFSFSPYANIRDDLTIMVVY